MRSPIIGSIYDDNAEEDEDGEEHYYDEGQAEQIDDRSEDSPVKQELSAE